MQEAFKKKKKGQFCITMVKNRVIFCKIYKYIVGSDFFPFCLPSLMTVYIKPTVKKSYNWSTHHLALKIGTENKCL